MKEWVAQTNNSASTLYQKVKLRRLRFTAGTACECGGTLGEILGAQERRARRRKTKTNRSKTNENIPQWAG